MKIVSVIQLLHGEIGRTISDVQKRDEQTDKQTDKQTNKKTQRFWLPRRRVKFEPHQTWHGVKHVLEPLKLLGSDAWFRR